MFRRKRKKTMADETKRPGAGDAAPGDEALMNELQAGSVAAAEHAVEDADGGDGPEAIEAIKAELEVQKTEHAALHDKYVRLYSEFDNFRKRSAKEKLELLQFAGADAVKAILPVLDDFERAVAANEKIGDAKTLKEGFGLIQQKFQRLLTTMGVKPMEAKGSIFDPELHEAVTKAPAPEDALKGKVIDVIENGYTMHERVIRYAKVIVGE